MQQEHGSLGHKLLLTPEQVADIVGLSRTVIYGIMRSGELRSLKIGRSRRITRAAVDAWVAEREREAESMAGVA